MSPLWTDAHERVLSDLSVFFLRERIFYSMENVQLTVDHHFFSYCFVGKKTQSQKFSPGFSNYLEPITDTLHCNGGGGGACENEHNSSPLEQGKNNRTSAPLLSSRHSFSYCSVFNYIFSFYFIVSNIIFKGPPILL